MARWPHDAQKVSDHELRVTVVEEGRPVGARAMRGFARRFRPQPRRTSDWMAELREGEEILIGAFAQRLQGLVTRNPDHFRPAFPALEIRTPAG